MELTVSAKYVIDKLKASGHKAYAVGGFVRNKLLNLPVLDVDVTTSATPDKIIEIFSQDKVYLTGLKHGTVTVNSFGENVEVTTFRLDGNYNDNRHPDIVEFVTSLESDLMRRDFTINAMAFDGYEVIDIFGGRADLENKIIRAVGDAEKRFKEDALRILRAMRFASVLDFEIEQNTAKAMINNAHLIKNVSIERVFIELDKMLQGVGVEKVLTSFKEVIFEVIPELKSLDGFEQNSKFHAYDVFVHTVKAVANSKADRSVRWALLFHDIAKPECYSEDEFKVGHFYGHQRKSAEISVNILKRLKADNKLISDCYNLILLHDYKTELSRGEIKKLLNSYGVYLIERLVEVKFGDAYSHAQPYADIRRQMIIEFHDKVKNIIDNRECFTLKLLKINGNDLKSVGFKGVEIKKALNYLLNLVMFDEIENEREVLLERVKNERFN